MSAPGGIVTVPVNLDTAAGLESAELRIRFDPQVLDVQAIRRGALTQDFGWFLPQREPGLIVIDASRLEALTGGTGRLFEVDFRVKPSTAAGRYAVDLEWASLNEGGLTLNPEPLPGEDPTDTVITVRGPHRVSPPLPFMLPMPSLQDGLSRSAVPSVPSIDSALVVRYAAPLVTAAPAPAAPREDIPIPDERPSLPKTRLGALLPSLGRLTAKAAR